MVVLDGGTMDNLGRSQYLQPDYLSPLPTTVSSLFSIVISEKSGKSSRGTAC